MQRRGFLISTLDRYFLWRFFSIYAANLCSFTLIFVLVDLVHNIDRFAASGAGDLMGFWRAFLTYYVAVLPVLFCQILGPVVAVSAALFTVTTLQKSNEFPPILAAGISYQRALAPVLLAALALSGVVFAIQELWVPRTAVAIRQALSQREERPYQNFPHYDTDNRQLIVFRQYDRFQQRAEGVVVIPVSGMNREHKLIQAEVAEWRREEGERNPHWVLLDGTIQHYDVEGELVTQPPATKGGPPQLHEPFKSLDLVTSLTPEDVEVRKEESVYLSLSKLRDKMQRSGNEHRWTIKYFSRFTYPAANFILVFLGLPVIVYFGNRNIFVGALVAVVVTSAFFFSHSIFQEVGVRGYLPARICAVLVPAFFGSMGWTLYRSIRT